METRSERTKKTLEDKLLALTAQAEKLCLLFERYVRERRQQIQTRGLFEEMEVTIAETLLLIQLKKHEPLPDWEMTLAQVKRCLDVQMPDQAEALFARLLTGPGSYRWLP